MLKRAFIILAAICLVSGNAFAGMGGSISRRPTLREASPILVSVTNESATSLYQNVTFSEPTKNLIIHNNNSSEYIYVDLTDGANTTDTSKCYLLAPDADLILNDFVTDGITFIFASPSVVSASDVSVLSVF